MTDSTYSIHIQNYFYSLNRKLEEIYAIAKKAREKGYDPELTVEIPIAKDIADRVEGLIGPKGVGKKIRELERKNLSRETVAFKIAEYICEGIFFHGTKEELAEQAIRTALAIITESITAAPLEGIAKIKIKQNDDNTNYLAVYYAGPIRSAGGTAAGMSVLIADFVRRKLGLDKYKPTEKEVARYLEEVELYNRVTHLQIPTSKEEQKFAAERIPVEITGEPTNREEVSGNRDLKRVETNKLRGGACLVFNDGIVGRAKKIYKRVIQNNLKGWEWLQDLIKIHEKVGSRDEEVPEKYEEEEEEGFVKSDLGYIKDVIAGRPVFAHPSKIGGFRIRYGRSRNTGLAAMGIHPALMALTDDFLASGTHVRTERPGKGAIVMPVDSIHPPIVKLKDGSVIKVTSYQFAKQIKDEVSEILFLGDMLYGVGEFNQNNYDLIPSGYCEEWWSQELFAKITQYGIDNITKLVKINQDRLKEFSSNPTVIPTPDEAIALALLTGVPLHPEYTYHWHDISVKDFILLRNYIHTHGTLDSNSLSIPYDEKIKEILENICIPHTVKQQTIYFNKHSKPLLLTLGIKNNSITKIDESITKVLDLINSMKLITIRAKAPVYTGARMGRPEKAKERKMKPPVHLLFPIEENGGRMRDLFTAASKSSIQIELVRRICPNCGKQTHEVICRKCKIKTQIAHYCPKCKKNVDKDVCPKCGKKTISYNQVSFPLGRKITQIKKELGNGLPKKVKAVKKLMNRNKIPESIEKGILRAKHNVFVYRDGTVRFDSTDAVLTHFKPSEIGISLDKLKELGYYEDINGNPIISKNQIIEIKVQDVIINEYGGEYLVRVANYIDELLEKLYKLPRYYNVKDKSDLIGHLIVGLAPHTSAGIVGRIIGFTKAKVNFAHPYWQAAKRRNCLFPTEKLLIWDEKKQQVLIKSIGEVVEAELKRGAQGKIVDDFGTIEIENLRRDWKVFSLDKQSSSLILQPIKHWIKGKSIHWLKIKTKCGNEIIVTPDHNMLVLNENTNEFIKAKAKELHVGDYIPITAKVSEMNAQQKKKWAVLEKRLPNDKSKNQCYELKRVNNIMCDQIAEIDNLEKDQASYCLEVDTIKNDKMLHNFQTTSCITMNCDGDEDSIILALDAFLNFSKYYLPEIRGGMMDAPLILVSNLNPNEVDDEAHNVDAGKQYPLSVYFDSLSRVSPKSVVPIIDIVSNRLKDETAYEGFHYTHETSNIFDGPDETMYKKLKKMDEKVEAQLNVAKLIKAVDIEDVAERIIVNHFIPDLIGNLKRFGSQKIRCTTCNSTYRRIPLNGICPKCKNKSLKLTVFEKSVTKYLDIADRLIGKYNLSDYVKDRLEIIRHNVNVLFYKKIEKQPLEGTLKKQKTNKKVKLSDFL